MYKLNNEPTHEKYINLSDNESSDESFDDSNNDSDNESDNESNNESCDEGNINLNNEHDDIIGNQLVSDNKNSTTSLLKKERKSKITCDDITQTKEALLQQRDCLLDENNEMVKYVLKNQIIIKKLNKKIASLDKQCEKVYNRDIKIVGKEKRKQRKPNNGGFNREEEVPQILLTYFGDLVKEGVTTMTRPAACSLLHTALKRDGCKDGKKSVINKKVAKKLKVAKDTVIEFGQHQTFLASFYH